MPLSFKLMSNYVFILNQPFNNEISKSALLGGIV